MLVAPAVVRDESDPYYVLSSEMFRSEEEAKQRQGMDFVSWPAGELIKVPYLEPLK
jgi:hypothetical protein